MEVCSEKKLQRKHCYQEFPCNHMPMQVCTHHMHVCPCLCSSPTIVPHGVLKDLIIIFLFFLSVILLCPIGQLCRTLAPCLPPPPSFSHHDHLLHLSSPTLLHFVSSLFVICLFWRRTFETWPFFFWKASWICVHLS